MLGFYQRQISIGLGQDLGDRCCSQTERACWARRLQIAAKKNSRERIARAVGESIN